MTLLRDVPVFGLLHLAQVATRHANLTNTGDQAVDTYLRCAVLCSHSIRRHGGSYTLITNEPERLRGRLAAFGVSDVDVVGQCFAWDVPHHLPFHSAHYKLELMEAFGRGEHGPAAALLDLDAVQVRPFDLLTIPATGLVCYDVTAHAGADWALREELEEVAGRKLEAPRWWGGEFIAGSAESFAKLAKIVRDCWPRYLATTRKLHHYSDEMVLAPALNILAAQGFPLIDAGKAGGIVRWWTARTAFAQPRLGDLADRSILHLPADKPFLAAASGQPFDAPAFMRAYRRHARTKLAWRRAANAIDTLRGGAVRHVARV